MVAVGALLADPPLHLARDPEGLLTLVDGLIGPQLLALAAVGPELLVGPSAVVRDHRVGGVEDALGRPVVLFELHHVGVGEVLLKLEDEPHIRAPPAVDALVIVSHGADVPVHGRQPCHEGVLSEVDILILIDEHVPKPLPPLLEHRRVLHEEIDDPADQVVEVQRPRGVEPALVEPVRLGRLLVGELRRPPRELLGRHELVLGPADALKL